MHKPWIAQILQGSVNIEQSKTLCAASLSLLCGDCGASRNAQRRSLKRQAVYPDAALGLHGIGVRLILDGPGLGNVFYYDVHSQEYTGAELILKGWAGSQRGIRKTLHMDFIHTRRGDPCFAFHADNNYDLRERVFMVLDRFNQLCPASRQRGVFGSSTAVSSGSTYSMPSANAATVCSPGNRDTIGTAGTIRAPQHYSAASASITNPVRRGAGSLPVRRAHGRKIHQ